jgi:Phytanoyl-CoA dioxygenase (PhyH)
MIGTMRRLIQPARYYTGPVWLNRAGLQVARMSLNHVAHSLRPRHVPDAVARDVAVMDRDGLAAIENFLSQEDFQRVLAHCRAQAAAGAFKSEPNMDGLGVDAVHGSIATDTEEGRWVVDRIAGNERLLAIVGAVVRRSISRRPQVIYQRLEVPVGSIHRQDPEAVLHADRHFTNVKAYLCLNDNRVENGAYVWAPGSHKFTAARLRHEYEYSIRETLFFKKGIAAIPSELVEHQRNAIAPQSARAMGIKEVPIETPANTLVISNNRGFHKRGTIQPGYVREQLRLIFQYLEEPFYATMGFRALGWASRRGLLSSRMQAPLRRRGLI